MIGKICLEDQQDGIRSACQFPIYQAAKIILDLTNKQRRREAINDYPEKIRPHIEAEVRRLWNVNR